MIYYKKRLKLVFQIVFLITIILSLLNASVLNSKKEQTIKKSSIISNEKTENTNTIAVDAKSNPITTNSEKMEPSSRILATDSSTLTDELSEVVRVVDGDTITVNIGSKKETLRLIGINSPETVDPRKSVECFGKEASEFAKSELTGKSVRLESDPSQGERDKYGRLLRYVFLPDGTDFNLLMIKNGFAYEYTYNLPYKYQIEYKKAQNLAKNSKVGLWQVGVCQ